jgi:hypothetical protein
LDTHRRKIMETRPEDQAYPGQPDNEGYVNGLTVREDFAARIMTGLLTLTVADVTEAEIKSAARTAVRAARVLIDELNAEEE